MVPLTVWIRVILEIFVRFHLSIVRRGTSCTGARDPAQPSTSHASVSPELYFAPEVLQARIKTKGPPRGWRALCPTHTHHGARTHGRLRYQSNPPLTCIRRRTSTLLLSRFLIARTSTIPTAIGAVREARAVSRRALRDGFDTTMRRRQRPQLRHRKLV